jgi:NADPH:quinone reductase-like Zn-dependent oxidoreductase
MRAESHARITRTSGARTDVHGYGPDMNAIIQAAFGAPEAVLRPAGLPTPTYGPGDVLVRVVSAAVNTPDWLCTLGHPALLRPLYGWTRPRVPVRGSDFAGIVEAVGANVSHLKPGDAVFGSVGTNPFVAGFPGTFRVHTVAPAALVARKPPELSFDDAAAAVMSGVVALQAFRDVAPVRTGHRVLVNGASGGIGTFAVPLAKAAGAHVTAVCSARNADLVRALGADEVLDYEVTDYTRGEARFDVILDNVANHGVRRQLAVLAAGGVLVPNSVGPDPVFGPLGWLAASAFAGGRTRTVTHDPCRENLEGIAAALIEGRTRCTLDRVYPLAEAGEAVARMASHRARGNVNLRVSEP